MWSSRRHPSGWLLLPVSLLFHLLVRMRQALYRLGWLKSSRLPVPVIIVGNIFVGGTGKTPLVIWLAQQLRARGLHPGVVSRGYRSEDRAPRLVGTNALATIVGDEPLLIARRAGCPVMVGADRVAAGRELLARHPEIDVLLSDDGLQHYALQRDVEIVLCDSRGNGNGWLLPAGPLREPASRRRDISVVNGHTVPPGVPDDAFLMQLDGRFAEQLVDRRHRIPLAGLAQSIDGTSPLRLLAAAGIGNPARFFSLLRQAGLHFDELPLPDHHDFASNPFAGRDVDVILITEKDAVKCEQSEQLKNDPRLWVVPVEANIDASLVETIMEKWRGCPIA
nr:tetraacyldisaccharide 4'-kinase [Noviherbaspirillum humi]